MTLIYFTLLLLPESPQYEPDHRGYAQGSHGLVFHRFLDIRLELFDSLLCLLTVLAGLLGDLACDFLGALGDVLHLVGGDVGHLTKARGLTPSADPCRHPRCPSNSRWGIRLFAESFGVSF